MASLKEIRGRITSVKGTLKITSAMRMISSAKLHSVMNAVTGMVPYEQALGGMLGKLLSKSPEAASALAAYSNGIKEDEMGNPVKSRVAAVLVTSNQTLCGAFNSNIIKEFMAQKFDPSNTDVYAVGRVGLRSLRKAGFEAQDCSAMASHADYEASRNLAQKLVEQFVSGKLEKVVLVYTHMVSKSTQIPTVKVYLPFTDDSPKAEKEDMTEYIVEPNAKEIVEKLLPQALNLKLHTALLDASAAEHAARTLAMQMATENAEELIGDLSLTYNKLRQQQITNEILDLVGGQAK